MTFAQFKALVKSEVIPDKESSRLTPRHDGWIENALIELQQKVPCLQTNHREYITQDSTYYSCGSTAFPVPPTAYVKSLRVQETANQCNYVDAISMTETVFRGILQNMQNCRCHPPTGTPYLNGYYYDGYEYDNGYYDYGDIDPELRPATSAIDLPARPCNRAFAQFEGNIWLWPVLQSDETAVLKWSGVRKSWLDSTVMPWDDEDGNIDREIVEAVGYYFMSKYARYDLCDPEKANAAAMEYLRKRGDMIVECVRKNQLPETDRILPSC